MSKFSRYLAAPSLSVAAAMALASCSGGGSSTPAPPPPTPVPTATPAPTTCTSSDRRPARASTSGVVPDQLYVTYRTSAGSRGVQSIDRIAGTVRSLELGSEGGNSHRAIVLKPGTDAVNAAAALRATPGVVDVAPVHTRSILANVTSPNDTYFNNRDQWYLFKTDVTPDAWGLGTAGAGVAIAVIDTGIDERNPDLAAKLDFRESIINGVVTTGAGSAQDANGHGSNVSGLANAVTNNGAGFAGVGYNARLMFYKIFADPTSSVPCPTASSADEALAIRDAVAKGAAVISLSLGSSSFDQAEANAVAFAVANNVTVVAAGGNSTGSTPDYPGADPGAISVGASSVVDAVANTYSSILSETVASYSNSGVTLVAPGGDPSGSNDNDVLHWIEGFDTTTPGLGIQQCSSPGSPFTNCRALFAGTSQATPQVAGVVALMLSYHGGAKSLSPATVTSMLTSTADSIGAPASRQGAGRLNAFKAVQAAHP
jgi:subtilisin family serine protease